MAIAGWAMARADAYRPDRSGHHVAKRLDGHLVFAGMIRNDSAESAVRADYYADGTRHRSGQDSVGLESGADDYIVKPFGLGEFLARVRVQMRRPSREAGASISDELTSGDLRLDFTGRRVFRG